MTKRTVDYDAFRRESTGDELTFKIGGIEYPMAPTLPASLAVDVIALQQVSEDDEADVPVELLTGVGETVFGSKVWRQILTANRIGIDELGELVVAIIRAYVGEDGDPDAEDPTPAST